HRIASALVHAGYLRFEPRRGYRLGNKLIELGGQQRDADAAHGRHAQTIQVVRRQSRPMGEGRNLTLGIDQLPRMALLL
ncbi:hypothetical protein ACOIDJ_32915, partial [Klebsiella pneumoniae]